MPFWLYLATFAFLYAILPAAAQEALQNSLTRQSAATARDQMAKDENYTVKYGDFRTLITPNFSAEWNDNINLTENGKEDDYILRPGVGFACYYPLTQRNVLFLDFNIGYDRYLKHPNNSTLDLNSASGTGLSFDLGVGDFTFNLHDWVRYTQDSSQSSQVANTSNYGTFQNTAGLAVDWLLNRLTLSGGYDLQYVRSTSAEFDNVNRYAHMFYLRSGLEVHPQATMGLETTAALTTYEQDTFNNNDTYTVGPYLELRPSDAMALTTRAGFSTYQFKGTSTTNITSDQNSWYMDVNFNHQVLEAISYNINAGRSQQLGVESDLAEIWYVRPAIQWSVIKDWPFSTGFFYEHGKEGVGNVIGNSTENYDYFGGNLSVTHPLTKRFDISLNYRLTRRCSDQSGDSYLQNLVGLTLTYHPR